MINIYIGFDSSNYGQELAYNVCKKSIFKYNNKVNIIPLIKKDLEEKKIFNRKNDDGSTEFTYTRFLVPYLNNYQDYAIFCDSDFLWNCNILEVLKYINKGKAISCVQHKYNECKLKYKMDGQLQEWYPRKNWSSLIVFNCSHNDCKKLNLDNINNKSAKWLHRMEWTENINEIPKTYNYLVEYYYDEENPKALHFTDGGPWYKRWYNITNKYDIILGNKWISYLDDKEKNIIKL